ncbi:membrane protein [Lysobacter arseniciresistens ZS79]|uniref:Membrane protein n=1 Tax=Lysobacter arseniciresistens ZS79 TaxID=913325 RepID=A0A0A0EZ25_9GAMM|nr:Mpo1-like protein [Lysobacter arseniciresistens]KGM55555.1 membrane protein [Lysobacter arseniciresistens ZS79]
MAATQRPIDRWFAGYAADHRNPGNQRIHVVCVPAIVWSIVALLWCIPAPGTWFRDGFWAGLAMFAATLFYYRQSRALGLGMLAMFALMALLSNAILEAFGRPVLLCSAAVVFVVAWIGQFIGHGARFEGRRPSFLTDLRYLLIGPAWVLAKLYRRLGLGY